MLQQNHRRVLAILFIFFGCLHLVVAAFVWIIFFALISEGYVHILRELKTLTGLGITLAVVSLPLLSGYALLRHRSWVRGAVYLTCLALLSVSVIALWLIAWPRLSAPRILFGTLYGGASLAISIYGFWFVSKRRPLDV